MIEIKNEDFQVSILPVSSQENRPLWSVMIPTYNCADYLRHTLNAILAQDLGADLMQIEVIDDCSTQDDPKQVVEEVGKGRVSFYQQPQNVGYIKNFNTCLQRSRGQFVHLLHGDDYVSDKFYEKMQQLFEQHSEIGAAFCRHFIVDESGNQLHVSSLELEQSGILPNWVDKIAIFNQFQPPAMVVRREVYEQIGGFDSRIACCGEDWEMWLRIAAFYPVAFEPEPLASYRSHTSSLTGRCRRSGQNVRDMKQIIEIAYSYLPKDKRNKLSQDAKDYVACWAIDIASEMLKNSDMAAVTQLQEAFKCSHSRQVIASKTLLAVKIILKLPGTLLSANYQTLRCYLAVLRSLVLFHSQAGIH